MFSFFRHKFTSINTNKASLPGTEFTYGNLFLCLQAWLTHYNSVATSSTVPDNPRHIYFQLLATYARRQAPQARVTDVDVQALNGLLLALRYYLSHVISHADLLAYEWLESRFRDNKIGIPSTDISMASRTLNNIFTQDSLTILSAIKTTIQNDVTLASEKQTALDEVQDLQHILRDIDGPIKASFQNGNRGLYTLERGGLLHFDTLSHLNWEGAREHIMNLPLAFIDSFYVAQSQKKLKEALSKIVRGACIEGSLNGMFNFTEGLQQNIEQASPYQDFTAMMNAAVQTAQLTLDLIQAEDVRVEDIFRFIDAFYRNTLVEDLNKYAPFCERGPLSSQTILRYLLSLNPAPSQFELCLREKNVYQAYQMLNQYQKDAALWQQFLPHVVQQFIDDHSKDRLVSPFVAIMALMLWCKKPKFLAHIDNDLFDELAAFFIPKDARIVELNKLQQLATGTGEASQRYLLDKYLFPYLISLRLSATVEAELHEESEDDSEESDANLSEDDYIDYNRDYNKDVDANPAKYDDKHPRLSTSLMENLALLHEVQNFITAVVSDTTRALISQYYMEAIDPNSTLEIRLHAEALLVQLCPLFDLTPMLFTLNEINATRQSQPAPVLPDAAAAPQTTTPQAVTTAGSTSTNLTAMSPS